MARYKFDGNIEYENELALAKRLFEYVAAKVLEDKKS